MQQHSVVSETNRDLAAMTRTNSQLAANLHDLQADVGQITGNGDSSADSIAILRGEIETMKATLKKQGNQLALICDPHAIESQKSNLYGQQSVLENPDYTYFANFEAS